MQNYQAHPKLIHCAHLIQAGAVIAYPTEGVWGLGCDPFNVHAVEQILKLKQRPIDKGLILISGQASHFDFLLAELDDAMRQRILSPQDKATTWLVPHHGKVPLFVSGASKKVAIRISNHPVVSALSAATGFALISTSANPAGLPSAVNATKVRCYFGSHVALAPGNTQSNTGASRIIDAETGAILR